MKKNKRNFAVLMVALVMALYGCGNGEEKAVGDRDVADGGVIMVEKRNAENSREYIFGGQNRTVSLSVSMEYPMHFGISKKEYRNLTELVNGMFNNGTNKIVKADRDYRVSIKGRMIFADARYFSYNMEVVGNGVKNVARTYDRKKGRVISLHDIVAANDFAVLCKSVREYIKFAMGPLYNVQDEKSFDREIEKALLKKLTVFNVDRDGVILNFAMDEWHMGINMEVRVSWDSIKDAMIDKSMIPTGRFNENAVHIVDENDPDWWKFPIEKYEYDVLQPPKFLWEGTNYPYASISHCIEIPCQGNIPKGKYDLFQSALGAFITHGKKPHATIKEAVYRETVRFWIGHIEESKNNPNDSYGIYELRSSIVYRGPEYVSYALSEQNGSSSGTTYTDFVWSWRTMRQLKIEEVIDMEKRKQLWAMIREEAAEYGDENFEWPDWAKEWPRDISKFKLDTKGVYWGYWAGDIFAGANGQMTIFLPWEKLEPLLRSDFIVPIK